MKFIKLVASIAELCKPTYVTVVHSHPARDWLRRKYPVRSILVLTGRGGARPASGAALSPALRLRNSSEAPVTLHRPFHRT